MDDSPTDFGGRIAIDERLDLEKEEIRELVPTEIDGKIELDGEIISRNDIPIEVDEVSKSHNSGCYQSNDYDAIPGGAPIISGSDEELLLQSLNLIPMDLG
jgi:hypothetical protein